MQRIYMDANATTPVLPQVVEAMRPFWEQAFGNASSIHQPGQRARAAVDRAREQVAALLGTRASEVVFTSGGTESDNLALFGMLAAGDHFITTAIEHHAVLHAAQAQAERGVEVTFLPCTAEGVIEVEALRTALRPNTRLVSVMLANNETGALQPVHAMAEVAHAAGALLHTDAVQAMGKIPVNVRDLGCDLLTLAGHKMYAAQGTGALYIRKGVTLRPMFFGGMHERGRRPGTENVAGLVGLGKAAEMARSWLAEDRAKPLQALRDRLEQGILAAVEGTGVNGGQAARVGNTSNIWFAGVEAEALVIALDLAGVAISGGAACQSGATEPSHVLRAMALSEEQAWGSVRLSLSRLTTEDEVARVVEIMPGLVRRLREVGVGTRAHR